MFPPRDPNAQFDPRDPRNMGRYPHGLLGMAINHFTHKPPPFTPYGPETPDDAGGPSDMFPDATWQPSQEASAQSPSAQSNSAHDWQTGRVAAMSNGQGAPGGALGGAPGQDLMTKNADLIQRFANRTDPSEFNFPVPMLSSPVDAQGNPTIMRTKQADFPDAASPTANRDEMDITGGSAFQPEGSPFQSLDQAQEDLNYATQFEGMARGGIITKPTVARLGERGPEAVVPLTPRAGNHLQPDLLEGHITEPKVPGMKLSRYKSFVNRDF